MPTLTTALQLKSKKTILRKAIQCVLASTALASGISYAQLLDHGPLNPVITFPDWYRDTEGLALTPCTSSSQYCFPLAPNPAGFVGNIGDEVFYNLVEFVNTTTGSDFQYRYMGALEASYLPGPAPVHGQETVFARIRITFNFNDPKKNGTYKVTHPFGVHTFENVQATAKTNLIGSQAANFFTVDVPFGLGFEGALDGPIGPFIKWDKDLPLTAGPDPKNPIPGAVEEFVGDPTYIDPFTGKAGHTFTGSPFNTNFIRIDGPVGSNLDGLGHDFLYENLGNVMGQKWTAPIAPGLKIDSAVKTRSIGTAVAGKNGIDVWASSAPQQELIVTGAGMPSLKLFESTDVPGKYHGHIEYPVSNGIPEQVMVTNLSSNPVVNSTAGLMDIVEISQATYDTTPSTRKLTVVAHSSDEFIQPNLIVQGVPGVNAGAMTSAQCNGLTKYSDSDVCYVTNLADGVEPPINISVLSTDSGSHSDHVLQLIGGPDNSPQLTNFIPVANDVTCKVTVSGTTSLTVDNCSSALPAAGLITQLPLNSTITHVAGSSTWSFTPTANTFVAPLFAPVSMKYVLQDTPTPLIPYPPVSNEATITLAFVPAAPTLSATTNITNNGFTVNWGSSIGATSYKVTANGVTTEILSTVPNALPPTTTSISAPSGTNTTVSINACNVNGTNCSTPSILTQFTLPANPVISGITNINSTGMTVNWAGVTGATGYSLQYSTNAGTTWADVGPATATTGVRLSTALIGSSTSGIITGLTTGNSYMFKLLATDPAGNSGYSNPSTIATTSTGTLSIPALTSTNISAVTTDGFTVTWPDVSGATNYNVTVNGVTTSVTTPTKTLTGLNPGSSNSITVAACNQSGLSCSTPTPALTQWTLANAPTLLTVSNLTDTTLTLSWTGTSQSFKVERATSADFKTNLVTTSNIIGNSTSVSGLSGNTTYYFRVTGVSTLGTTTLTGLSSETAIKLTLPSAPTGTKGVDGNNKDTVISAGISWTSIQGLNYDVMWGSAAQLSNDTGTIETNVTSGALITMPGIAANTSISLKVRAKTATTTSAWSNTNPPITAKAQ